MLCALAGPPRILRLHGRGRYVVPAAAEFDELSAQFEIRDTFTTGPARRSIVVVDVERVADSKGGPDAIAAYRAEHNMRSIDGLPALES
jgi:hypothetical protein